MSLMQARFLEAPQGVRATAFYVLAPGPLYNPGGDRCLQYMTKHRRQRGFAKNVIQFGISKKSNSLVNFKLCNFFFWF